MRFLLISDTHGKLETINELSASVRADAVIHAGDFGFYDGDSYERLSDRELRLHISLNSDFGQMTRHRLAVPG
jgi:predicted phosphodiesterase